MRSISGVLSGPAGLRPRRGALLPVLLGAMLCTAAAAPDAREEPTEPVPGEAHEEGGARVRCWAMLGDATPYSLYFEGGNPKRTDFLFSRATGFVRTGYGRGYTAVPAGTYRFALVAEGREIEGAPSIEVEMADGSAHSLLVTVIDGEPVLRAVPEYPTAAEDRGIVIYNLLEAPPLHARIGNHRPMVIPFSPEEPVVIPPEQIGNQTVTLIRLSRRNLEVRTEIPYDGGRTSAVFTRNRFGQPTVLVAPAEPAEE